MDWEIHFNGLQIKEKQEELMSAISELYKCLKEYETENGYLQSIWRGPAATMFFEKQMSTWEKIGECAERTMQLVLAVTQAEEVFAQGEKEVRRVMEEKNIWKI